MKLQIIATLTYVALVLGGLVWLCGANYWWFPKKHLVCGEVTIDFNLQPDQIIYLARADSGSAAIYVRQRMNGVGFIVASTDTNDSGWITMEIR